MTDVAFPPRDETLDFLNRLNVEKYQAIGAPLNQGLYVDDEGVAVWMQEYLRYRVAGLNHIDAAVKVFQTIDGIRASSAPPITPDSGTHLDPTQYSLRELAAVRGAMWTVRGPWRFGPRPGSPDNITALEFIHSYGDPLNAFSLNDEQRAMLSTYQSKGYTHVAYGPPCAQSYHGQYPDTDFSTSPEMFNVFLDWLQMFWDHHLKPVVFFHKDGDDFDQHLARWDHLIRGNARAQKLIRIIVPTGWEPTQYGWSSVTWAKFCAWAREVLPNALVLIHTVADVDAPVGEDAAYVDTGHPNGEGWSRVAPHLHGWLIQNGAYKSSAQEDPALAQNFASQFDKGALGAEKHGAAWHFINGIAGWPTFSAWGDERIYLYGAEQTSYEAYWNNLPEASSESWGDLSISSGSDGYLDGGRVPVNGR